MKDISRIEKLKQRQRILSVIREDLSAHHCLEVETPILVKHTTPDAYIDSIIAEGGYLITSTEYQIKQLISDGFTDIFTLTKNFRAYDRGRYHSPEFTMLEWGRAFHSLRQIEEDAERFIKKSFCSIHLNKESLTFNENEIQFLNKPWQHLTVREAFEMHLNIKNLNDFSLENLCEASENAGVAIPNDFKSDRSLAISFLLDLLQTHLGKDVPTFLHEWPSYQTSSAPDSKNDPYTAERSELYIGGIEIANGFPFLTDPQKQRQLFEEQLQIRKATGKSLPGLDEKYIECLKDLPQGAGMALGVDRLVMVLTESKRLSDVQAFDWDEL